MRVLRVRCAVSVPVRGRGLCGVRGMCGVSGVCGVCGVGRTLLQVHECREQARVGLVERRDAMLLRFDDPLFVRQRGGHLPLFAFQLFFDAN